MVRPLRRASRGFLPFLPAPRGPERGRAMRFGEVAEALLQLAANTPPGEGDDAHEPLLETLRAWFDAHAASDAGDAERHASDVRMLSFLLAAIEAAEMPGHGD